MNTELKNEMTRITRAQKLTEMNRQINLIQSDTSIDIKVDGCEYKIMFQYSRDYLSPKWFVQNMRTFEVSKRYYSFPGGAANALFNGSIVWEK